MQKQKQNKQSYKNNINLTKDQYETIEECQNNLYDLIKECNSNNNNNTPISKKIKDKNNNIPLVIFDKYMNDIRNNLMLCGLHAKDDLF